MKISWVCSWGCLWIVHHAWASQSISLTPSSDVYKHTLCEALTSPHNKKTKDVVLWALNSQFSEEASELRKVTELCFCILIWFTSNHDPSCCHSLSSHTWFFSWLLSQLIITCISILLFPLAIISPPLSVSCLKVGTFCALFADAHHNLAHVGHSINTYSLNRWMNS